MFIVIELKRKNLINNSHIIRKTIGNLENGSVRFNILEHNVFFFNQSNYEMNHRY